MVPLTSPLRAVLPRRQNVLPARMPTPNPSGPQPIPGWGVAESVPTSSGAVKAGPTPNVAGAPLPTAEPGYTLDETGASVPTPDPDDLAIARRAIARLAWPSEPFALRVI